MDELQELRTALAELLPYVRAHAAAVEARGYPASARRALAAWERGCDVLAATGVWVRLPPHL